MSSSNCCFLACIQISQEAGHVVWYSHLFQNIPQFIVIHHQRLWQSLVTLGKAYCIRQQWKQMTTLPLQSNKWLFKQIVLNYCKTTLVL